MDRRGQVSLPKRVFVAGVVAFALIAGAFVVPGPCGPAPRLEPLGAPTLGRPVLPLPAGNCSGTALAHLAITPVQVAATPLQVLMFSATSENVCGTPLTPPAGFSWWLSSVSLGTLNSSTGSIVAYTACIAPMGGVLHVKASSGAVTLYANSTITVSASSSSGPSPSPSTPGGFPGGVTPSSAATISWSGLAIMVALFAAALAVLMVGLRKRR